MEDKVYADLKKNNLELDFFILSADNLPLGEYRYSTNPFMNQITYNHTPAASHWERDCMLFHLEHSAFDPVRGTERFTELLEKIKSVPGIEYP